MIAGVVEPDCLLTVPNAHAETPGAATWAALAELVRAADAALSEDDVPGARHFIAAVLELIDNAIPELCTKAKRKEG